MLETIAPNHIAKGRSRKNASYFMSVLDNNYVNPVNIVSKFERFSEEELKSFYFKTDHHWNIYGAFEAYKIIAETLFQNSGYMDKNTLDFKNYKESCIPASNIFKGTYNTQIYMSVISNDEEKMCTYLHEDFNDYEVFLEEKRVQPFSIYHSGINRHDNKEYISYGDLFTRDYKEINIINKKNDNGGNILILKDSYTNPIIFHIAQGFYKTTIYDLRHNKGRTVREFIEKHDYDVVAILYNSTQLGGELFDF